MDGVGGAENIDYISHKSHQEREGKQKNNLKEFKSLENFFICSMFVGQKADSFKERNRREKIIHR